MAEKFCDKNRKCDLKVSDEKKIAFFAEFFYTIIHSWFLYMQAEALKMSQRQYKEVAADVGAGPLFL
jgi:hypothetical protein